MINISQYAAADIMTVRVLEHGRADVPFWNWQISPVAKMDRPGGPAAFVGAGLYAICFDGQVIYIGSFSGSDKGVQVPIWHSGDIIPGRWTRHVGSITGRCNLLSTAPRNIAQLLTVHGSKHPMVKALVDGSTLKHKDAGCQGSFNRLHFAALHWNEFETTDPTTILKRFSFVYARLNAPHLEALHELDKKGISQLVKSAESHLISTYKPLINDETATGEHLQPLTCQQAGPILTEALMSEVQLFMEDPAKATTP